MVAVPKKRFQDFLIAPLRRRGSSPRFAERRKVGEFDIGYVGEGSLFEKCLKATGEQLDLPFGVERSLFFELAKRLDRIGNRDLRCFGFDTRFHLERTLSRERPVASVQTFWSNDRSVL